MIVIRKTDATIARVLPTISVRPDVLYIPSQFALPFEHNGKRYCFNNLTKQCIEGSVPVAAKAGEGFDELIKAQFLVPADKDECAYYNQISSLMRVYSRKKGIRGYTILPTLGCNARCVYCYEEGMQQVTMTPEIVEQAIRFILDTHQGDRVKLSWFGGEPLLCPNIIDRICEGMRDAGLEYKSSMISNGSLITPEIIGKMGGDWKLNHIQVSMDGAEADYIPRKHYYNYQDQYRKVMEAVSAMSAAGISVTVRCNVDEQNWGRIPQYLQDLSVGVANKEKVSVYFAPLNAVRMSENDLALWTKLRDLRPLVEGAGFRFRPFLGLGTAFRTFHCMADAGSVVVAPDGSLYPCEHCPPGSRFGDIWHGVTDESAKKAFCRTDVTREKCRKCPFLPDCTSFASCLVQDVHCREVRELMALDTLKRLAERKESESGDEDSPAC